MAINASQTVRELQLKRQMQSLGFSDEEFRYLEQAQQNSDALVASK